MKEITVLGNLKSKISIMRNANVSDSCGGYINEWILVKECRASVKPLRANEIYKAQQIQQETTHNIIIRYFEGLQNSDIIRHKGKEYEISSVINVDNESKFFELICIERGN